MARPRKKRRTQQPGEGTNARANGITKNPTGARIPQSMVIRMGGSDVGSSITQLVHDMREAMQPHTAGNLRERRGNRLRDYTAMAGPLGVSHLLLFSKSTTGNTSLRIANTPRGPTLGFRVEKYSLARDIAKAQRRPKTGSVGNEHLTPPLLVMNNFASQDATAESKIPRHLEQLTTSMFQSLFPPISPQRTPLGSIKRVLLVNRERASEDEGTFVLSLRHYAISSKPLVSLSRGIKRLVPAERHAKRGPRHNQAPDYPANGDDESLKKRRARSGGLPDMGRLQDVADYVLDPSGAGYTSASDSEVETDAEVEVLESDARRVISRKQRQEQFKQQPRTGPDGEELPRPSRATDSARSKAQKRAVKLTEIGPRMTLRLVKVEEGLCDGKVMWHEFYEKSEEEIKTMQAVWDKRRQAKEERRRVQKENIMRKKKENGGKMDDGEELGDLDDEDWDDFDGDDNGDEVNGEMEVEDEDEVEEE